MEGSKRMSDRDRDVALRATLKAGAGYDAPWLSVDATDPDDLTNKLNSIANGGAPQALIEAANALKAANNAAPLLANGALPVGSSFGGGDQANAPTAPPPPQQSGGWGGPNTAPPQNATPQQQPRQAGWQAPATYHPGGKTCDACGQGLEYKKTSTGKGTWRCGQWRWNNGTPNEHTQLWA